MTAIPGYSGPSPAAKQFTVSGVACAIDVYFNAAGSSVNLIVAENAGGVWTYLNNDQNKGLIWSQFILNAPIGLGTNQTYQAPGMPPVSGTFADIVSQVGATGMVWPWLQTIMNAVNARFGGGSQPVPSDSRTAGEVSAQQSIAGAVAGLSVTVTGNTVMIAHP